MLTAIALTLSGITYVATTIWKNLPPKEGISIVSVESTSLITVVNTGETDLLVTSITFSSDSSLFQSIEMRPNWANRGSTQSKGFRSDETAEAVQRRPNLANQPG
jgi:hypothetical protein